jgi:hypothetical protein
LPAVSSPDSGDSPESGESAGSAVPSGSDIAARPGAAEGHGHRRYRH